MNESERFSLGKHGDDYYSRTLKDAETFTETKKLLQSLIPAEEQLWENSPQGLLKHLTNDSMNSAESAINIYQQVIEPGGNSGKHRHLSEEIVFILEGDGYDLHWDPIFAADEKYDWDWQREPKQFEWRAGDFVYIPPNAIHQHFAAVSSRVRLLSATSQLVKVLMGTSGLQQIENSSCSDED